MICDTTDVLCLSYRTFNRCIRGSRRDEWNFIDAELVRIFKPVNKEICENMLKLDLRSACLS